MVYKPVRAWHQLLILGRVLYRHVQRGAEIQYYLAFASAQCGIHAPLEKYQQVHEMIYNYVGWKRRRKEFPGSQVCPHGQGLHTSDLFSMKSNFMSYQQNMCVGCGARSSA